MGSPLSDVLSDMTRLVEGVRKLNAEYKYKSLTVPIRKEITDRLMNMTRVCLGREKAKEFSVVENPPESGCFSLSYKGPKYDEVISIEFKFGEGLLDKAGLS